MIGEIKDIDILKGTSNPDIMLIAPHGVAGDDDNTGDLVRSIHGILDCSSAAAATKLAHGNIMLLAHLAGQGAALNLAQNVIMIRHKHSGIDVHRAFFDKRSQLISDWKKR